MNINIYRRVSRSAKGWSRGLKIRSNYLSRTRSIEVGLNTSLFRRPTRVIDVSRVSAQQLIKTTCTEQLMDIPAWRVRTVIIADLWTVVAPRKFTLASSFGNETKGEETRVADDRFARTGRRLIQPSRRVAQIWKWFTHDGNSVVHASASSETNF